MKKKIYLNIVNKFFQRLCFTVNKIGKQIMQIIMNNPLWYLKQINLKNINKYKIWKKGKFILLNSYNGNKKI